MNRYVIRWVLIVLGLVFWTSQGRSDTFHTLTSAWVMGDMAVANGAVWTATGGGLLKVTPSGSDELFNTEAEFPSVRVTSLALDEVSGFLWVGFDDAHISIFDPVNEKILSTIRDFHQNTAVQSVFDIAPGDSLVWVISELTLSSLAPVPDLPGRYVVKQTYRQFAGWPAGGTFSKLAVYDGAIFIGGPSGVLRGDLSLDLLDATNWEYFTWAGDLEVTPDEDTDVDLLRVSGGRLFLSGGGATFVWDGGTFDKLNPLAKVNGIQAMDDGSLLVAQGYGLWRADSLGNLGELLSGDISITCKDIAILNGVIYSSTRNTSESPGGLLVLDGSEMSMIYPDTPVSEGAQVIETLSNGDIVVAGNNPEQAGVARFDGVHWQPYLNALYPGAAFSRYAAFTDIVEDGQGGVWVGTSGNGVHVIAPLPTGGDTVVHYDKHNSVLSSYAENDNYVIVQGMLPDPSGGLWVANSLTWDGVLMCYVPRSWLEQDVTTRDAMDWITFTVGDDGVPENRLGRMVMDAGGRIWIGYPREDNAGNSHPPGDGAGSLPQPSLTTFDPAGTPEDKSDDIWRTYDFSEFAFASNLELDEEGLLWMSTEVGLFWIDTNLSSSQITPNKMSATISEFVTDVQVDPLNQIWATTDFGVAVLAQDRYSWVRRYTTEEGPYPSPLIEANVNAISFAPETGRAWLATTNTVTVITTPYRAMGGELGDIEVAPQPFMVGPDAGVLSFSTASLVSGVTVRIFTASGRFVRELSFDEAVLQGWDGKDSDGDWVGSGVYLILVTDPGGESKVGKAAVVRR